ncbi:hypothetical protein PLESTB_001164400 [Pleodorina starrii]|uniref:Kinesin motor domain-containing protein n=1 Tax=Pleodorina starrii TaxID=330485 RepID=A0A9W6BRJ7_9CHLO|nr:hypothetical protein PLESTM_000240100 [Pleodorina starrii]GLC56927.1 hypothetical protein PLESTB_001164400 [Pleodorina starrii]GLC64763.1 hypothetical protein PLESTF_000204800 [Pleodorina starrii]
MEHSETGKMRLKVLVRLRPTPEGNPSLVHGDHRVLYLKDPLRGHNNEFVFDGVLGADAKQDAVFQEVGMPLVEHVMQGYNACCLAYGHTGSGKTYTMFGRELAAESDAVLERSDLGIIPRACEAIAKAASVANRKADHAEATGNGKGVRVKLFVSFMEVYMENVRDLGAAAQAYLKANGGRLPGSGDGSGHHHGPPPGLGLPAFASADGAAPSRAAVPSLRDPTDYVRTNLDVMEDAYGMTFVKDLTYMEVSDADDMRAVLQAGYAVRPTCPIDLSSRAHTIFSIHVVTYRGDQQPVTGRLNLVDLAGSEKQSRSGAEGHRLREASAVTKSLTALSKVVVALSQAGGAPPSLGSRSPSHASSASASASPASHVPYRDAKLTRVLKDSLCGNCMLVLLGCVYPIFDEVDESLATLQFATKVLFANSGGSGPHVNLLAVAGGAAAGLAGGAAAAADPGLVEELSVQVVQLKDELEVTHAHYQKLIEAIAGPSWRSDPGPVERAPGGGAIGGGGGGAYGVGVGAGGVAGVDPFGANGAGLNAFAAALSTLGKPGGGGAPGAAGGAAAAAAGGNLRAGTATGAGQGGGGADDRSRGMTAGAPRAASSDPAAAAARGGGHLGAVGAGGKGPATPGGGANSNASARVSVLEAQIRKLESQLNQARNSAQQYEERLSARKEEMEMARERMAGKEHAQFAEIKKLRAQVAELTKALEAERTESAHKLEDAKRRSDDECARLMRDIDTLRNQLAQVTGTVSSLVEKHSAAITAEKRQREVVKKQATQLLQQQFTRGTEEHRAQLENLKQQSAYFLTKRSEELTESRQLLDAARAAHAAEKDALLTELDYLASYSERVTELVRRMEAGVVPVTERGNGVKAFRLPQRERPPRLDGSRLAVLKDRAAELHERLIALSASTSAGGGANFSLSGGASAGASAGGGVTAAAASSPGASFGPTFGGWVGAAGATSPGRGGMLQGGGSAHSPLGSSVDLDALRAQVEAELKAQVTAQVVGDLRSEKTVEYIRELETAVGRYRQELQSEKKRSAEMAVALRSVQRQHQRPESPINKAIAAHTPAGTIKLAPTWGLGHSTSRGGALGGGCANGVAGAGGGSGGVSSSGGALPARPATAGLGQRSLGELTSSNNGRTSAPASARRPTTSMAALTSSFRENGMAIP